MLEYKESPPGTGREGALQNSFLPDSQDNNSTQNSTALNQSYPYKSTLDKQLSIKTNDLFSQGDARKYP